MQSVMLQLLVRIWIYGLRLLLISDVFEGPPFDLSFMLSLPDDGKLDTESDSGEFWVLFGGFAPIGKKSPSEDDVVPDKIPAKLYR